LARLRRWPAQMVDAAVVGDAVEPRAQDDRAVVGAQRRVGAQEHVLEGVLGVRARPGQHLPRVREQALAVAVMNDAERLLAARAKQSHELVVRPQAKQWR